MWFLLSPQLIKDCHYRGDGVTENDRGNQYHYSHEGLLKGRLGDYVTVTNREGGDGSEVKRRLVANNPMLVLVAVLEEPSDVFRELLDAQVVPSAATHVRYEHEKVN